MLVKAKESVYYSNYTLRCNKANWSEFLSKSGTETLFNGTSTGKNLKIEWNVSSHTMGFQIMLDNAYIITGQDFLPNDSSPRTTTIEPGAHTLVLKNAGNSSFTYVYSYLRAFSYDLIVNFTQKYIDGKPIEIKTLGNLGKYVLYGVNPNDNIYYGGIITGDTSSATTGSITLGNAVGFLEINYNGEIVKVPYYS